MKISVVISTYNGAKYIEEELESIRNQTQLPDEVLIFDDVSSDGTVEICDNFIKENKLENWSVTVNAENKGWRRNFMEGISQATGEIIFIADQDDIWARNKIEIMANVMIKNKGMLLLTSDYIRFTSDYPTITDISDCMEVEQINRRTHFLSMRFPGCTYCIRRELFDDAYKVWEPDFAHDAILLRVAAVKDGFWKVKNTLHYWRIHEDSTFAVETEEKRNRKDRRDGLELMTRYLLAVRSVSDKKNGWDEIIDKNIRWEDRRKNLYDKRSLLTGIRLLGDLSEYRDFRQYVADLYLALMK